jgi:16S rRNA (guanine527-N7)-methyltransferase
VEPPLSRDDARLTTFCEIVVRWAPRVDLVSPSDLERLRERHIDDSLRVQPLLRELPVGPVVDVGSGAGFPGIPLAIVAPERHFRLLEPRTARAAFLEEAVRLLELDCEVLVIRAEEAGRQPGLRRAHALSLARALAPPTRAFQLLAPLTASGGASVVFVGEGAALPKGSEVWRSGLAIVRHQ